MGWSHVVNIRFTKNNKCFYGYPQIIIKKICFNEWIFYSITLRNSLGIATCMFFPHILWYVCCFKSHPSYIFFSFRILKLYFLWVGNSFSWQQKLTALLYTPSSLKWEEQKHEASRKCVHEDQYAVKLILQIVNLFNWVSWYL